MTRNLLLVTMTAMTTVFTAPAFADCAADVAALRSTDSSGTASTAAQGGKTTNFDAQAGSAAAPSTGPISKDGSIAPLGSPEGETAGAATAMASDTSGGTTTPGQSASGGKITQDGSTSPLAAGAGQTDPQIAVSGQDASSQQSGGTTAATAAEITAALDKAQKASDAGNEQACQEALKAITG